MSSVYFSSDIHFNHQNILQYCSGRGSSVEDMNETIIDRWNKKIPHKEAEVYILGDVAMGKIAEAPALIAKLNGRKHIILGNHDRTLVNLPVFQDKEALKEELNIVEVTQYKVKTFTVDGKKIPFVMFHFPIAHFEGQHHGAFHLHGHLHGSPCSVPGKVMDVGLDTNNLTPYSIEEVATIMRSRPLRGNHHSGVEL